MKKQPKAVKFLASFPAKDHCGNFLHYTTQRVTALDLPAAVKKIVQQHGAERRDVIAYRV